MSGIERMSAAGSGLYILTPSVSVCSRVCSNTQAQNALPEVLPAGTGESLETCPIVLPCAARLDGKGEGLC